MTLWPQLRPGSRITGSLAEAFLRNGRKWSSSAYLSRACFDVHYVRYSDAPGNLTICFISYLQDLPVFVFNIPVFLWAGVGVFKSDF